ncbi:branched-chain amino acid ABC transporter substrate-binding protein [Deinococcus metallilatus]|uniref:Branched-chain amino acid ABC transporter substrate-binding protein n=1 Tax=Deinococcus metallilatus TaxID=1211322 RepID=A0AAJ5JYB3_9DEIO|nr:branched-chain amino acid ABC transporter substrate-binding protein [Deinococcus metallilatus]MBB5294222.1 branched-chain amino acid transport system substrate-binding protein [Deinococcus metallilatus]QBY09000.1 branched-chain amino acid ABC transporter substrate-binding protein [Deinococcus metallilatus]RXJ10144.1 branched-chain amino acid ABC transporter substrate-binding protein [Deinococcus metallilatus]TLK27919.1 branched-chain amino acid ABC transporter substrate-binding protein [Dein
MKKTALSLSVLAALALGSASAQTTVKIATLSPLSGGQSDLGTQIRNGAQLAVNEYKPLFKKIGLDLQLVAYDDQADPATGTAQARKIASDRQILAVVGTLNSGVAIPSSAALAPSHVAMVSPANTANQVTDRGLSNMNRIVARDDAQGPAGANFIARTLKAKKVYILNDKTAYGEGLAKEVEKALKADGVQVVANEGTEEKSDFSSIIAKIKLQRPDAVYFGGIYNQVGVFIKQLREAGINAPVIGGDGLDSSELATIAGQGANDIYFTTVAAPIEALPAAKVFATSFKQTFNDNAQGFGAFGYDAAKVVLQGILDAARANGNKAPSRMQVETAIRKGNFTGLLSGNVTFNSVGDRKSATLYVMNVQGGKYKLATTVPVKPARQ